TCHRVGESAKPGAAYGRWKGSRQGARRHLGSAQLSGDHSRREPVYEGGRQHSFFKKSAGTPIHRVGGWEGDLYRGEMAAPMVSPVRGCGPDSGDRGPSAGKLISLSHSLAADVLSRTF